MGVDEKFLVPSLYLLTGKFSFLITSPPPPIKTIQHLLFAVVLSEVTLILATEGAMSPTDEVIMAKHLLESTLMGGFFFLGLMIGRQHHYMRELRMRRKRMEVIKKEGTVLKGEKARTLEEVKSLKQEITSLAFRSSRLPLSLPSFARGRVPSSSTRDHIP
ncbi:unnamed protein product [Eruca vesicaria subsp. sativa]|uniref:Endoplasmic reticulum transmembrane protein n=1 Tax=Eruca vesicaria subsp. sativa TaxID=29727 RepID=A0ABC8K1R3_ERUVS|nr:unnamed protein product [Eruca vesicaria subsp. sativa]